MPPFHEAIRSSGARESGERTDSTTARDYIRGVLKRSGPVSEGATNVLSEASVAYGAASPSTSQQKATRSQWERITLAGDIELHVRRPLSRAANKQVERLIDAARDIFTEEQ